MKKIWALRYVLGMLLAFGLAVPLCGWIVTHYPVYVIFGLVVIFALIVANQPRVKRERARIDALVEAAFKEAYSEISNPPIITRSSSYGYPAFEVKFESRSAMMDAAPANEIYKKAIGHIFTDYGPKSRPFAAQSALFFTYKGHIEELQKQYETKRNGA